jgi:hypothetical protein
MYREWVGAQPGEPARVSSEHWITIYHSMISNGRWMDERTKQVRLVIFLI